MSSNQEWDIIFQEQWTSFPASSSPTTTTKPRTARSSSSSPASASASAAMEAFDSPPDFFADNNSSNDNNSRRTSSPLQRKKKEPFRTFAWTMPDTEKVQAPAKKPQRRKSTPQTTTAATILQFPLSPSPVDSRPHHPMDQNPRRPRRQNTIEDLSKKNKSKNKKRQSHERRKSLSTLQIVDNSLEEKSSKKDGHRLKSLLASRSNSHTLSNAETIKSKKDGRKKIMVKVDSSRSLGSNKSQSRTKTSLRTSDLRHSLRDCSPSKGRKPSTKLRTRSHRQQRSKEDDMEDINHRLDYDDTSSSGTFLSEQERLEKARSKIQSIFSGQRKKELDIRLEHAKSIEEKEAELEQQQQQLEQEQQHDPQAPVTALSPASPSFGLPLPPAGACDTAKRRWKAFDWYRKFALPNREIFKELVKTQDPQVLTEQDVDLLPWVANGSVVNIPELMKSLPSLTVAVPPNHGIQQLLLQQTMVAQPMVPQLPVVAQPMVPQLPVVSQSVESITECAPPGEPERQASTSSMASRSILKKDLKWSKMPTATTVQENGINADATNPPSPSLSQHLATNRWESAAKSAPSTPLPNVAMKRSRGRASPAPPLEASSSSSTPTNNEASSSKAFSKARQIFLQLEEKNQGSPRPVAASTPKKADQSPTKQPPATLKRQSSISSVDTASTCGESLTGRTEDPM